MWVLRVEHDLKDKVIDSLKSRKVCLLLLLPNYNIIILLNKIPTPSTNAIVFVRLH